MDEYERGVVKFILGLIGIMAVGTLIFKALDTFGPK